MIIINSIVVFNIIIIAVLLLFRKNNVLPNKILALIFIIPGLNFLNNLLILSGTIYSFPYSYFIVQGTGALFAPLVYYYILLLIGRKITYQKVLFLISALLIVFTIYVGTDFAFQDETYQLAYIRSVLGGPYPIDMEIYSLLFFLLQLVYLSLGALAVYQYQKNIKDTLSDMENTKLAYLKHFIILFWSLTFITILLYSTIDTVYVEYIFLPIVICIIYFFILYSAFHANAVFSIQSFTIHLAQDLIINKQEEARSTIENKPSYTEGLPQKIEIFINENKSFKEADINLQKLAQQLNMPSYLVSKAINDGLGTSFYDMINKKRVEEAELLLMDKLQKKLSIEGIAYESGFNSRTAFYRAFKKYSGKHPSELIEN